MKIITMARVPVLVTALFLLLLSCRDGVGPDPFPDLVITTDSLETAVRGQAYAGAVSATGGDGAYTWEIVVGGLPAGLTLMVDDLGDDNAIISGVPEVDGTFAFTVRVRSGDGQEATAELALVVVPEVPVAITTPAVPPALAGSPYNVRLSASGGDEVNFAWSLVEGSLPAGLSLTTTGRITGTPSSPDTTSFTVEVSSIELTDRMDYTLAVVPNQTTAFNVTIFPIGNIPTGVQPHLDSAVAQWERAIVGNFPVRTIPTSAFSPGQCGGFGPLMNGTSVDDILIALVIEPIDGPGQVLGRAGPCVARDTINWIPFVGFVLLDEDDVVPLIGNQTLTHIISHEIGHVLGFGTVWDLRNLIEGEGGSNPRFIGAHAVQEYQNLGGTGTVPVENQGGAGTRDSHWRQANFGNERMTGFSASPGTFQPLSRVSVASFMDIGYAVNLDAADDFSLASALAPGGPGGLHWWGQLGWDEVVREPLRALEP